MKATSRTVRQTMTTLPTSEILAAFLAEWGGNRREVARLVDQLRAALITGVPVATGARILIQRTAWENPVGFRNTVDIVDRDGAPRSSLAFTLGEIGEMPIVDNTATSLGHAEIASALVYEMGFHGSPDQRDDFALTLADAAKRA